MENKPKVPLKDKLIFSLRTFKFILFMLRCKLLKFTFWFIIFLITKDEEQLKLNIRKGILYPLEEFTHDRIINSVSVLARYSRLYLTSQDGSLQMSPTTSYFLSACEQLFGMTMLLVQNASVNLDTKKERIQRLRESI